MKKFLITFLALLLYSGILYASGNEINDSFKGSFGIYDVSAEMVVLKKIESMTDPETEKMMIGTMSLKFDYIESELARENGMQVAYVHFTDKKDHYILTYYVDGYNIVKIILFSKNGDYINKELYPAKYPDKKETSPEEKKQDK